MIARTGALVQAAALGLPEDTPLITAISNDPTTIVQRKKSPLEEARSEPMEAPTFPIAKNVGDLTRFATMPEDHLIYAGTWAALCVSLAAMATYAIRKPARTFKMVGEQTASKMYNK